MKCFPPPLVKGAASGAGPDAAALLLEPEFVIDAHPNSVVTAAVLSHRAVIVLAPFAVPVDTIVVAPMMAVPATVTVSAPFVVVPAAGLVVAFGTAVMSAIVVLRRFDDLHAFFRHDRVGGSRRRQRQSGTHGRRDGEDGACAFLFHGLSPLL